MQLNRSQGNFKKDVINNKRGLRELEGTEKQKQKLDFVEGN